MLGFIIKRVLWLIPTLLVMTLLTYFIMELTPGSPFDLANANGITPEMIARLEHQYGLDKPWYERYVIYVKNALQGDFGESYSYRPQQVSDIIARTMPDLALARHHGDDVRRHVRDDIRRSGGREPERDHRLHHGHDLDPLLQHAQLRDGVRADPDIRGLVTEPRR